MPLTSYNSIFGWIHTFKINQDNQIFSPSPETERPFPIIVEEPTWGQVISNWNTADTGLVSTFFLGGLIFAKTINRSHSYDTASLLEKRFLYKRHVNLIFFMGLSLALLNSYNRLTGYVPNGLPKKRTEEVLKYDYTSEFANNSFWKYFYAPKNRPTNNS